MSRPPGKNRGNDDNKSMGLDGAESSSSGARNYKPEKQLELESRDTREGSKKDEERDQGPAIESIKRVGFNVVKILGIGSYAIVYKVVRINPIEGSKSNEQAVKSIYLDDRLSNNYKTKFLPQELETLMKIKHDSIILVHQIIAMRNKTGYLIFMDYAPGGTLSDVISKKGAQSEKIAKDLFSDIFRALGYMHAVPFAHRDMKLENILLDRNGRPKITDFSYGVYCGSTNHVTVLSKTFCGTTPYMPPEILQLKPYSPLLADVWSLGVCLYIFVIGTFPFHATDDPDILLKSQFKSELKMKPKRGGSISTELNDLIKSMLQTDSSERITMSNVLFHPWIQAVIVQKNKSLALRK